MSGKRTHLFLFLLCAVMLSAHAAGEPAFTPYPQNAELTGGSPASTENGLEGFLNPALLAVTPGSDLLLTLSSAPDQWTTFPDVGLFGAFSGLGAGMRYREDGSGQARIDMRIGIGFGDRSVALGFSNQSVFLPGPGQSVAFEAATLGALIRPFPFVSLGLAGTATYSANAMEATADLGIRPFGTPLLTLFGEYAWTRIQGADQSAWRIGLETEALKGVRISGRVSSDSSVAIGARISMGQADFGSLVRFASGMNATNATYSIRAGTAPRPSLPGDLMIKERYYLEMNLRGSIVERGSPFTGSHSLLGLLRMIKEAGDDPKFAGIAINASGLQAEGEVLWELMEALKEFKSHGKKVVMYIDMASFASYAFATAADRIVLDPEGFIEMSGVVVARGYFKGSLEKLGIGFQEIRLFTYKTAAETFSRDSLSDADREQYGTYIADLYQTIKQQVTEGRRITGDDFDRLIDEGFLFHARQSKERGLVDALGRWEDVKNIVKELEGSEKAFLPYRLPFQDGVAEMMGSALGEAGIKAPAPDRWGEPPTIALVYAIGGTSMDSGMSARKLSRDIEAAGKDQSVKAIVIRVDSPGGQAVAADYVAQSMKTAKKSKPLIVSQGSVAGSGGYWVSMFGDSIFSSPITLTGSIGVIADWFYDNGLNEKLGASTDFVQIGKHADLQAGLLFPHRDLTAEERGRYEEFILAVYKDFVEKVAQGRQKSTEEIEAIAQGRVWSGLKAKEIGLIDEIGNLEAAIAAAREKAKISPSEEIQIRELPRTDFLSFLSTAGARLVGAGGSPWGLPMPSDLSPREQRAREYLLFRLKHNGEPLPILPAESLSLF